MKLGTHNISENQLNKLCEQHSEKNKNRTIFLDNARKECREPLN